jgi:hypothetical protein
MYARTFHYLLPAHSIRARIRDLHGDDEAIPSITAQIYVPIDDDACWIYNYLLAADPAIPFTTAFLTARNQAYGRAEADYAPGYRLKRNAANDYLIDRGLQRTTTFSGIAGMNTQDIALQEGMGAICDRSREHLSSSDRVIIAARQLLFEALEAIERGDTPRGVRAQEHRGVRASDRIIGRSSDWRHELDDELLARY